MFHQKVFETTTYNANALNGRNDMSKKLLSLVFLASIAASLVSAYAASPVKKPPPPDYFPLRVSDWWKYKTTTADGKQSEFTLKVINAEKQPDESIRYQIDTNSAVVIHDWYGKPKGLVLRYKEQFGDNNNLVANYDPVYQYLKNPLVKDDTWDWAGKGMSGVDIKESSKVSGPEEVIVPAGKFSAMKVVTNLTQGGANITKTYWFADWVGMIKGKTESSGITSVSELVDYSFKKPPTEK
jgi:hypothetical protein